MKNVIEMIAGIVNYLHDSILRITTLLKIQITDKELHFWIIGLIGIFIFALTQIVFKFLSKWSITAISFIYTFTVLIVIVFAIEIQQRVTNRGNMEFADVIAGINGFLFIFAFYLFFKTIITIGLRIKRQK